MRLKGQNLDARFIKSRQQLREMSYSRAGRHNLSVLFRILDVSIFDIRLQKLPSNKSVLLALHEVGGVENALESGQSRVELIATLGDVAVDALFVLVAKIDARALRRADHIVKTAADLVKASG